MSIYFYTKRSDHPDKVQADMPNPSGVVRSPTAIPVKGAHSPKYFIDSDRGLSLAPLSSAVGSGVGEEGLVDDVGEAAFEDA